MSLMTSCCIFSKASAAVILFLKNFVITGQMTSKAPGYASQQISLSNFMEGLLPAS